MSIDKTLSELFDAERAAVAAEERLLSQKPKELVAALVRAVDEAFRLRDQDEAELRLRRLASLCGQVEGPETADALIRILDCDDDGVRLVAGEELENRAYERYAEFARAVDRALDRKSTGASMLELPHIIAAVGEPSAILLLRRFLAHEDPEVCAEAIGALAELGDPAAIEPLRAYVNDQRVISVADEEDDEQQATLGQLAVDAIEMLESIPNDDDDL